MYVRCRMSKPCITTLQLETKLVIAPSCKTPHVTANTRGLIMKAAVVSDAKVRIHTEDGVLYVMGRLNGAEITDLNQVLQQVGNVTKIITLVDNIEQQSQTTSAFASPMINATPTEQTPVAIDPDQVEPNNVQ